MSEFYGSAGSVRRRMEYLRGNAKKIVEANINQASAYIQTGDFDNPLVYSQTCMKLGSTIDSAIAMNAVPSSSHLPQLRLIVREVYRRKTELQQPSLMLLMLPIKAACQVGWFPDRDKDDLLKMAKEVCNGFSNIDKMSIEPSYAHSCVSNIISRFYPTMKVENILTSFNVKAGYGTFVVDFHISHGTLPRHCRNLWLLVARMDNMDTSACIASPSNVDFLINGSGVPRRTKSNMGKGPQLPSNVTKMIKYGVNLLQVLGDFEGQYFIAVAFMNLKTSPDTPSLQDYVHTMPGAVDSDCDVSDTSTLISLDCPISKLRIRTPVKGHLCKHRQCFDYKYFMEVNSRWPTWNCPICNNPVCNLDIRIDHNFLKILNEVAEHVSDVSISADGSWTVAMKAKCQTITPNNYEGQTQADVGPSTTEQAQSTTMFTPPATTSPVVAFEKRDYSGPVSIQFQPPPPPPSPPSGDVMPVGRMRGSLRGDQLAAARDRLLAPPQQPLRASEPWSMPPPTLPIALLMQRNLNNSDNTVNVTKQYH